MRSDPERLRFEITARDGAARTGVLHTAHGPVTTPAFIPLATRATVRSLESSEVEALGYELVLGNTFHLLLAPGPERIADLGGLHEFMGWRRAIITDSGGFQIFSLAHGAVADEIKGRRRRETEGKVLEVSEDGVRFRSYVDGTERTLGPEGSMEVQAALGSDIALVLDECTPFHAEREYTERSMHRTHRWLERCVRRHRELGGEERGQALFGIVQGGVFEDLRARSVAQVLEHDLVGYAVGGVSVGESREDARRAVAASAPLLPEDRPRYLMGVGTPEDFFDAVERGVDLFDCVTPTRHARNHNAFTSAGKVNLRNARWREDPSPLDAACDCPCCARFSKGVLRHLCTSDEMLGAMLLTLHNLRFFHRLMERVRAAISEDRLAALRAEVLGAIAAGHPEAT